MIDETMETGQDFMSDGLETAIRKTILESRATVKEIASALGRSQQTVYTWADPLRENWPPLMDLPRLMRASRNISILRWLAKEAGFLLVRPPRPSADRPGPKTVHDFQRRCLDVEAVLMEAAGGRTGYDEADNALYSLLEDIQALRTGLKKQREIDFEEGQRCLF